MMSALRRSNTFSYLALYSRIRESLKYSCGPRSKYSGTGSLLFSSLDHQQRSIRSKCTTYESQSFQDMLSFRKKQAKHSVLIELSSTKDIPCILNLCKHHGAVKNMIVFVGKHYKFQVIAEFVHEESVQKLLFDASLKNVTEVVPCHSRCLYYENKGKQPQTAITSDEVTDLTRGTNSYGSKVPSSVSEMMVKLYEKEKVSDLSTRLRFLSCVMLENVLTGMFPHCIAFPFGSSVNGFGNDNSDLDLMLRLFPEQSVTKNPELFFQTKIIDGHSHEMQRRTIYALSCMLQTFVPGVSHVRKIIHARVPIVKYHNHLLNLECDISVSNMAAVYMSEILYICGEFDPRVRPLVYTVKKWAREANVTFELPGSWITNFTLALVMLFFLQTRKIPILPPLNKLIILPCADDHKSCAVGYVNEESLKNSKPAMIRKNSESLGILLQEFFSFLAIFPFNTKRISLIAGTSSSRNDGHAMWIDYPLDESFNVSRNISHDELQKLCSSACTAVKNLEKNSSTDMKTTDLMSILGVSVSKQDSTDKIDVRAFLDETFQQKKVVTGIR